MSADLVSQLHPPRLPTGFTQMGWPDLLAGLGIGLILAALILWLAQPFLRARPRPRPLAQRLRDSRALPPPERVLALTRLLSDCGGQLPEDLRPALYAPSAAGTGQVADQIEALVLAIGQRPPAPAARLRQPGPDLPPTSSATPRAPQ